MDIVLARLLKAMIAAILAISGHAATSSSTHSATPSGKPTVKPSATPSATTSSPSATGSGTQPNGPTGGHYTLTFDDEFNGSSLSSHWSAVSPFSPNGDNSWSTSHVTVANGSLTERYSGGVSGIVSTAPGIAPSPIQIRPGSVVEARVFLPAASNGSIADWPAVWLDGQSWPTDGEIDIMEGLGGHACYHIHDSAGGPGGCASGTFSNRWDTFTADWSTSGVVSFYYNGKLVGSERLNTSAPEYLVLELNTGDGGQTVNNSSANWDYVRVWNGG